MLTVLIGAASIGIAIWFFSRPVIALSTDSPLWTTEDDAARQETVYPGPASPKEVLKEGDKIRIVWIKYGKDYKAAFIVGPGIKNGWILTTQKGVAR